MFPQRDAPIPFRPSTPTLPRLAAHRRMRESDRMKLRLASPFIVVAVALTACSSGGGVPTNPTGTQSPEPSSLLAPANPSDEAFCAAFMDWFGAIDTIDTGYSVLGLVTGSNGYPQEAPSPELVHETSLALLAAVDDANAAMTTMLANISDPDVADTLDSLNQTYLDFAGWIGALGRDSADVAELKTRSLEEQDRFDAYGAYFDALDMSPVDAYLSSTCGDLFAEDSSPKALDTSAKADVSTLGNEIATYYVDWQTGDPAPVIEIVGDTYELNGEYIADHSPGVEITDQWANSYEDWCIEVTIADGLVKTFHYSAMSGLDPGTCR